MNILGYKIFNDSTEASNWLDSVNTDMGFPNSSGTEKYSFLSTHPSDGRLCSVIDSSCPPNLIPNNLITLALAQTEGFYPISNDKG